MTALPSSPTALSGVRVIDLTDELGAYAGRLLADLGAEVVRVELPGRTSLAEQPPRIGDHGELSAFERFVNASKTAIALDPAEPSGAAELAALVDAADVVIESSAPQLDRFFPDERVAAWGAQLVRVIITPFGLDQPRPWPGSDDLLVMAEGGLLHLGGYTDLGPVVAYGSQSRFAASLFGAVSAITGLIARDVSGQGGVYDVSAQECIAQALEDSAATYSLTGQVRERLGDKPREAGTGVYPCRDGYVSMVAGRLGTARAWTALVTWLNEAGAEGAEELLADRWQQFSFRQSEEGIETFARIFEGYTRQHDKMDLYREAQSRMIAMSPVSTVADLLGNEQLHDRDFFVSVDDPALGESLVYPRPPYRLSATPPTDPRPAPVSTARVLASSAEGSAR